MGLKQEYTLDLTPVHLGAGVNMNNYLYLTVNVTSSIVLHVGHFGLNITHYWSFFFLSLNRLFGLFIIKKNTSVSDFVTYGVSHKLYIYIYKTGLLMSVTGFNGAT